MSRLPKATAVPDNVRNVPAAPALVAMGSLFAAAVSGTAFLYSNAGYDASVIAAAAIGVLLAAMAACVLIGLALRARLRGRTSWQWIPASLLVLAALVVVLYPNRPLSPTEQTACRRGNAVLQVLQRNPHDPQARALVETLRPVPQLRPPIRAAVSKAATADPSAALRDLRAACI